MLEIKVACLIDSSKEVCADNGAVVQGNNNRAVEAR